MKAPGGHEKRSAAGFTPIRITPHFVEPLSSTFRTQLTSQNGVLMKVLSLLSNTLQVHPIPGSFTIPPKCDKHTYGKNIGKCRNLRTTQCGSYTVPSQFVGKREFCTSSSGSCYEAGPDGAGVANTDFLLFVRTQCKSHNYWFLTKPCILCSCTFVMKSATFSLTEVGGFLVAFHATGIAHTDFLLQCNISIGSRSVYGFQPCM